MYKKIINYLAKHPNYSGLIHVVLGVGIGILITYPFVKTHPVRWGVILIAAGILGHLYPIFAGKK